MLRYTRGRPSYAALLGDSFGRAGAALLNVFVAFNCVGTLTVYLIIIGDVMSCPASGGKAHAGVLPEWFGPHRWTGREAVLVAAAVILLPLVLRKRVGNGVARDESCLEEGVEACSQLEDSLQNLSLGTIGQQATRAGKKARGTSPHQLGSRLIQAIVSAVSSSSEITTLQQQGKFDWIANMDKLLTLDIL